MIYFIIGSNTTVVVISTLQVYLTLRDCQMSGREHTIYFLSAPHKISNLTFNRTNYVMLILVLELIYLLIYIKIDKYCFDTKNLKIKI